MPRGTTKCLLLAGCPLGACAANLQEVATVQAAQRHFESGVNFYKAGDYESARIEFGPDSACRGQPLPVRGVSPIINRLALLFCGPYVFRHALMRWATTKPRVPNPA